MHAGGSARQAVWVWLIACAARLWLVCRCTSRGQRRPAPRLRQDLAKSSSSLRVGGPAALCCALLRCALPSWQPLV